MLENFGTTSNVSTASCVLEITSRRSRGYGTLFGINRGVLLLRTVVDKRIAQLRSPTNPSTLMTLQSHEYKFYLVLDAIGCVVLNCSVSCCMSR